MTFQLAELPVQSNLQKWERVSTESGHNHLFLQRMPVPGGWVYANHVGICFVPQEKGSEVETGPRH